jgi:hypothetical protein
MTAALLPHFAVTILYTFPTILQILEKEYNNKAVET